MAEIVSLICLSLCGILLCGLSTFVLADDKVNAQNMVLQFNGQLISTSCAVTFHQETLLMEPVNIDKFIGVGSTSTYTKNFQLVVAGCNLSPQVVNDIRLSFSTVDGQGRVSPGAFSNQIQDGAQGVGFAIYNQLDGKNVLTPTGESRVFNYPVTSNAPVNTPRTYNVKYMQTGTNVTTGQVSATLLVSAFYH